jgi:hypothetical protein
MTTGLVQSKDFTTGVVVRASRIFFHDFTASDAIINAWFFGPPVRFVNELETSE